MKTLYIIRGLPGSGKTTMANELVGHYAYCEADQFFTSQDGSYHYDKEKIREAHEWCKNQVKALMILNQYKIAVSNTFVKRWEIQPYVALAQQYGYRIVEITMSGDTYANLHNVPEETIQRMKANWEK